MIFLIEFNVLRKILQFWAKWSQKLKLMFRPNLVKVKVIGRGFLKVRALSSSSCIRSFRSFQTQLKQNTNIKSKEIKHC